MNWKEIRQEYESTNITMKDLADKHGVKPPTLRSRKNREKWSDAQRNASSATRNATRNATQRKNVATPKVTQQAKEVLSETDLSDWEEVYCLEYLRHFNRTKAYQKAKPGVTYESAMVLGSRKFGEIKIQKRLGELKQAQKEDLYINALDIKRAWVNQSFADITDYVDFKKIFVAYEKDKKGDPKLDEHGEMIPIYRNELLLKDSTEIDGSVIQEVKEGRDGITVKLYDKQKAMAELMKYLETTGTDNPITIVNAWGDDDE